MGEDSDGEAVSSDIDDQINSDIGTPLKKSSILVSSTVTYNLVYFLNKPIRK